MTRSMKNKDLNFLVAYENRPKNRRTKTPAYWAVLSLILVVVVIVGVYGILLVQTARRMQKVNTLRIYTQNQSIAAQYKEYSVLESRLMTINGQYYNLSQLKTVAATFPMLSADRLHIFLACGAGTVTVEQITFESETGHLSFSATTSLPSHIPEHLGRVSATGLFSNLEYSGYSQNRDAQYVFSVECTVKAAS